MQLVITDDGSHTLFVPSMDEHYHSTFGAINESMHVFVRNGLNFIAEKTKEFSILEVGFGTGLNALLTCITAIENQLKVTYYTIEKYPIDATITGKLNYPALLSSKQNPERLFNSIHQASWNEMTVVHPNFHLYKIQDDITTFQPGFNYDIIFYDAFAPEKQPEMWTRSIFTSLYKHLKPGGILTTYCVKGLVKRMLKSVGFSIEKLPGPRGKREMLRGKK